MCWIYGDIGVYQFSSETTIDLLFVILVLLAMCCCWYSFCSFISFSIHRISIVWRFQVVCFSVCLFFLYCHLVWCFCWRRSFFESIHFNICTTKINVSLRTHNAGERKTFCFANFIIFIRHNFLYINAKYCQKRQISGTNPRFKLTGNREIQSEIWLF